MPKPSKTYDGVLVAWPQTILDQGRIGCDACAKKWRGGSHVHAVWDMEHKILKANNCFGVPTITDSIFLGNVVVLEL